jgi:hypothetical protein
MQILKEIDEKENALRLQLSVVCSLEVLVGGARWRCSLEVLVGGARWRCSLEVLVGGAQDRVSVLKRAERTIEELRYENQQQQQHLGRNFFFLLFQIIFRIKHIFY